MRASTALVFGWTSVAAATAAGQVSAGATPQVITTGVGEATAAPDRAAIYLSVQTRGPTAAQVSSDNARRVRGVLDTLRAIGIGSEALQTASYNVSPEVQYGPNQAPRVTGFTATNSTLVNLKHIDDVGRVIDAALAKGANDISSLQFSSSKADSIRSVALAAAVADARTQAEAMARAAGGSLGPLIELSSTYAPVRTPPFMATAMLRTASTPITPGEQTIDATVTGRWTFIPSR